MYDLSKIKAKVAMFGGAYDRLGDPKDVAWLKTQIPKKNIVWYDDTYPDGHITWMWGKQVGYFKDLLKVLKDN